MKCPRCGRDAPEEDLRRFEGLCLECVYAFTLDDDPPEIPGYEGLSPVGRGGMGVVYRALQTTLQRHVAIKFLSPHSSKGGEPEDRFLREARALAQLSHPNVVAIHDCGVREGTPYLVMEFVVGTPLRKLLSRGPLSPGQTVDLIAQICDGLDFAHSRGIVHRDIKPENLLIGEDGRVRIADFGLAKLLAPPPGASTRSNVVLGTPRYMAPEQMEGSALVDARADLYSLGAVFYEMLTGSAPLGHFARPSALAPVDARYDRLILKLLDRDPGKRHGSARDVRAELPALKTRRRPNGLILGAVCLAVALLGFWLWPPSPPVWGELGGSASGAGLSRDAGAAGFASLALDPSGLPVVAWDGGPGEHPEIYVRRWTGREWADLGTSGAGGGVSRNPGFSQEASIAVDAAGNPVVAWRDDSSGNWEIYLRRWTGTAWEELDGSGSAGGLSRTPGISWTPTLAIDRQGRPVVAWHDNSSGRFQILLRRWDDARWNGLGGSEEGEGLSRVTGDAQYPRVALDGDGRPVVAWHDFSPRGQSIHVKRWTGAAWEGLGVSDRDGGISGFGDLAIGAMKLDAQGRPAVTWVSKDAKEAYFRRWDGSRWIGLDGSGSGPGVSRTRGVVVFATLALDAKGNPAVAWMEDSSGNPEIAVRHWDGAAWVEIAGSATGGGVSRTPGESADPSLAVDPSGRLIVVWHDLTPQPWAIYLRRTTR